MTSIFGGSHVSNWSVLLLGLVCCVPVVDGIKEKKLNEYETVYFIATVCDAN